MEEIVGWNRDSCSPTVLEQMFLSSPTVVVGLLVLLALALLGCSRPPDNRSEISSHQSTEHGQGRVDQSSGQARSEKSSDGESSRAGQLWSRAPGSGELPVVLPQDHGQRMAYSSGGEAPQGPIIERILGYKTGGEYVVLPSRSFPQGMAVVTLPSDYESRPDKKYPLIIVFGGAGECAKPPRSGALAWMHYYKTDEAVYALRNNHLVGQDFRGLARTTELDEFNQRLKKQPYDGVILACPYSPLLSITPRLETPEYESYIIEELIPALKNRYRVATGCIGVDGVSMGGARSMYYGFKYPEIFASIGSVQGAFGPYMETYGQLVTKNGDILKKRPIQLVTSDKDPMAPSVEKMHKLLESHGIIHSYLILTGPHDYVFNQGPGCLSLLIFHNQALAQRSGGPVKRE